MTTPTKQNQIPRAIALILISLAGAFWLMSIDASTLAKLESMSATDYVQKERDAHHHAFIFHFIVMLIMGGFYIGVVDFISYVIGLCFKKPAA